MQLHQLTRTTPHKRRKRIGLGGKRGKTSGRGTKGQKARTGHKIRPELRDVIKRIPKLRGHGKNRARTVNEERVRPMVINVGLIDQIYTDGGEVSPRTLVTKGLLTAREGGRPVKILGDGALSKKVTIVGCLVSASAREKIAKAGGMIS